MEQILGGLYLNIWVSSVPLVLESRLSISKVWHNSDLNHLNAKIYIRSSVYIMRIAKGSWRIALIGISCYCHRCWACQTFFLLMFFRINGTVFAIPHKWKSTDYTRNSGICFHINEIWSRFTGQTFGCCRTTLCVPFPFQKWAKPRTGTENICWGVAGSHLEKRLDISEVINMLLLLLIIALIIASCLLIILLFGLAHASRRADEGEEKILKIILPKATIDNTENASQDKIRQESPSTPREQHGWVNTLSQ